MSEHNPSLDEPDFSRILRANLQRVFNERDGIARAAAVDELFVDEPIMYEPTNVVRGRAAISDIAGKLLEQFGPTFRFMPEGSATAAQWLFEQPCS
jgi:hypothetical protein